MSGDVWSLGTVRESITTCPERISVPLRLTGRFAARTTTRRNTKITKATKKNSEISSTDYYASTAPRFARWQERGSGWAHTQQVLSVNCRAAYTDLSARGASS